MNRLLGIVFGRCLGNNGMFVFCGFDIMLGVCWVMDVEKLKFGMWLFFMIGVLLLWLLYWDGEFELDRLFVLLGCGCFVGILLMLFRF